MIPALPQARARTWRNMMTSLSSLDTVADAFHSMARSGARWCVLSVGWRCMGQCRCSCIVSITRSQGRQGSWSPHLALLARRVPVSSAGFERFADFSFSTLRSWVVRGLVAGIRPPPQKPRGSGSRGRAQPRYARHGLCRRPQGLLLPLPPRKTSATMAHRRQVREQTPIARGTSSIHHRTLHARTPLLPHPSVAIHGARLCDPKARGAHKKEPHHGAGKCPQSSFYC